MLSLWLLAGRILIGSKLDPEILKYKQFTEYRGSGRFFGIYPAKEKLCCFIGMPRKQGEPDPAENRIESIQKEFGKLGGSIPKVQSALKDPNAGA